MTNLLVIIRSLIFVSLFATFGLTGCQTVKQNPIISTQTAAITVPIIAIVPKPKIYDADIITFPQVDNIDASDSYKFLELPVSSLNRYDWQLVHPIDSQGGINQASNQLPLMLEVRPNNLVFKYDCQRYLLRHEDYSNNNYSDHNYSVSSITNITPASCSISDTKAASDLSKYLTELFPKYGRGGFSLDLLSSIKAPITSDKPKSQKSEPYKLVINAQNRKLVFEGTLRPLQLTRGLPINNELLEKYKWRLVSAIDGDKQPITELNYRGVPIYAGFYTNSNLSGAGFSSNCNGVGGPYILTPNNKLLIGAGSQTMMGCGPKREAAEDKIKALEQLSKSQLTLQQLLNTNTDDPDLPYYLLTQQLETSETLIWKNVEEIIR